MRRATEYATEYKNGNVVINVKDKDALEGLNNDFAFNFSEIIYWLDMYYLDGEVCSWGNDEGYYLLWCTNTNKIYRLFGSDIESIKQGKATRLYGYDPDEDDMELIDKFLGE